MDISVRTCGVFSSDSHSSVSAGTDCSVTSVFVSGGADCKDVRVCGVS